MKSRWRGLLSVFWRSAAVFGLIYGCRSVCAEESLCLGEDRIRRQLGESFSGHSSPVSMETVFTRAVYPDLSPLQKIRAIQVKYKVSNNDAARVMQSLVFPEKADARFLSRRGVLEILCRKEYADDRLEMLLAGEIKKGKAWYAPYYLRLANDAVGSDFLCKIAEGAQNLSLFSRLVLYREIILVHKKTDKNKKRTICLLLADCIQKEKSNLGQLYQPSDATNEKVLIRELDSFLKSACVWSRSTERLNLLDYVRSVGKRQPLVSGTDYWDSEISWMQKQDVMPFGIAPAQEKSKSRPCPAVFYVVVGLLSFLILASFLLRKSIFSRVSHSLSAKNWNHNFQSLKRGNLFLTCARNVTRVVFLVCLLVVSAVAVSLPEFYKGMLFLHLSGFVGQLWVVVAKWIVAVGICVCLFLLVGLMIRRLQNAGISRWKGILFFIPILSCFVLIWCLSCQQGYGKTKKMDLCGKIVSTLGYLGIIAPFVVLFANG